jgi:hypothetical protein
MAHGSSAPEVAWKRAIVSRGEKVVSVEPLAERNLPPANTVALSQEKARLRTWPWVLGLHTPSSVPVLALKAARLLRVLPSMVPKMPPT